MVINHAFWQGKTVLVTGHTGFKGSWLSLWLKQLGARVVGLSLAPSTQPNLFEAANIAEGMDSIISDICDLDTVQQVFEQYSPDIVIHMAAQALVRQSYTDPVQTYQTNVVGTMNILEAMRLSGSVQAAVMITTDKCYDNKEWLWPYREADRLGGHDPYSSSKACCELLVDSYRRSFFSKESATAIATARAGNVIGGGDWSQDRLIPDIVRAKESGKPLMVRYPEAIRPWQHVLDPLRGYLILAEQLATQGHQYAQAWNFGPNSDDVQSVRWIGDYFAQQWHDFKWEIEQNSQPHEAGILKLDCSKASEELNWESILPIKQALDLTASWYQSYAEGADMAEVSRQQLKQFYLKD